MNRDTYKHTNYLDYPKIELPDVMVITNGLWRQEESKEKIHVEQLVKEALSAPIQWEPSPTGTQERSFTLHTGVEGMRQFQQAIEEYASAPVRDRGNIPNGLIMDEMGRGNYTWIDPASLPQGTYTMGIDPYVEGETIANSDSVTIENVTWNSRRIGNTNLPEYYQQPIAEIDTNLEERVRQRRRRNRETPPITEAELIQLLDNLSREENDI